MKKSVFNPNDSSESLQRLFKDSSNMQIEKLRSLHFSAVDVSFYTVWIVVFSMIRLGLYSKTPFRAVIQGRLLCPALALQPCNCAKRENCVTIQRIAQRTQCGSAP
jgi:hypothetical protein